MADRVQMISMRQDVPVEAKVRYCTPDYDEPVDETQGASISSRIESGDLLSTVEPAMSHSDNESDRVINPAFRKDDYYFMPNKSQVLLYLTDASLLRIRRTGMELQVTDSIDFPLFDVWVESDCWRSTWILESYGRTVLLSTETSGFDCFSRRKSEPIDVVVTDWNGDLFGYFVPGDPFTIKDSDKRTVAKLITADPEDGRGSLWVCILEGAGREIARLEDYSTVHFARQVGFQMKLLTLAAVVRLAASKSMRRRRRWCAMLASPF